MTDEFQRGLITGLAMQPLQVTTEHATPDPTDSGNQAGIIIGDYKTLKQGVIIGEIIVIPIPEVITEV